MDTHITVGPAVEGGWRCVDDAGRPVFLPREAVGAVVRDLRVGQRLSAAESGWTVNGVGLRIDEDANRTAPSSTGPASEPSDA